MNVTVIVGNGLDVELGIPTRYSDFYEYMQEKGTHKNNQIYQAITEDPKTWSNFEVALGAHTQVIEEFSGEEKDKAIRKLHRAFDEVLSDLGDYLEEKSEFYRPKIRPYYMKPSDFYNGLLGESWRKIAGLLGNVKVDMNFITLNYTDSLEIMLYPARQTMERRGIALRQIHHAHGKLSEYITMGVSNDSQISAALEGDSRDDLIKPLLLESMNDDRLVTTGNIIRNSGIIVIYGTSLGETDEYIWQQVIEWLKESENRHVVLHDHNREYKEKPTRNPARIKQLDNEAKNRLLNHGTFLFDEDRVRLRARILVVRNTQTFFKN